MKRNKATKAFLLLFVLLVICYFWQTHENKINREYFESLDLKLTGVIKSIDETRYNGFCIIDLQIISSNISYYDPRKKLKNYYCIIKNNSAEVYQCDNFFKDSPNSNVKVDFINDTIKIDTDKETFILQHDGSDHSSSLCDLNSDPNFYEYIKNHHQDF